MQGALPPAPPASPRNSRGATPCQAINFDIFRHIERECSQGFKGGDFRRKYYPSLDGTERHTALAEGKATRLSLLPHGKAVGMLKYDKEDGYKVPDLTQKQEKLIDGIAEYGAKWAKEDGFPDMAEDMEKHIGISKGIADTIEPPRRQISRGWDMEL